MGELIESSRLYDIYNFFHYGHSTLDAYGDNVLFRLAYSSNDKSQKIVKLTFEISKCNLLTKSIEVIREIGVNFYNSHTLSLHVFVWDFVMDRRCQQCLFLFDSAYLEYFNMHLMYLLIFDMRSRDQMLFKLNTDNFAVDLSAGYDLLEIDKSIDSTQGDDDVAWVLKKTKNEKFAYYRLTLDRRSMNASLHFLTESPEDCPIMIQSECLIGDRAYFLNGTKPNLHIYDFVENRWTERRLKYPNTGRPYSDVCKCDPRLTSIGGVLHVVTANPESYLKISANFYVESADYETPVYERDSAVLTYGDKCKILGSQSGTVVIRSQSQCGSYSYLNFVNKFRKFPTLKDLSIRRLCDSFDVAKVNGWLTGSSPAIPRSVVRAYFGPQWSLACSQKVDIDVPCSISDNPHRNAPFRRAGPF